MKPEVMNGKADVYALTREVVHDGQALDPATVGQLIEHEAHAHHVVRSRRRNQLLAQGRRELDLLATAHSQLGFAV